MNKKDKEIIIELRKNARVALTKMSREIGIPVSTIFDRIKIFENEVILKNTCLLNFDRMGYHARANITIKADREDKDMLKEYLMKHESINSVFKINNGFDFMVEGVFLAIKDVEDFLEGLEKRFKIKEMKSFFIIEDLKREGFFSDGIVETFL